MRKKIFFLNIILIFSLLFSFFLISLFVTYNNNMEFAKDSLKNYTQIYKTLYNSKDMDLQTMASSVDLIELRLRITVIDKDGSVIAESARIPEEIMENHLEREEISSLLSGEPKFALRYSQSVGTSYLYYAQELAMPDSESVYLRLALPVKEINTYLSRAIPLYFVILIVAIAIAWIITRYIFYKKMSLQKVIKKNLQAVNKGVYKKDKFEDSDDDLRIIRSEISQISDRLEKNTVRLKTEKDKFNYVFNNINDAIFSVNKDGNIELINNRAKDIFTASDTVVGQNLDYLIFDNLLSQNIRTSLKTKEDSYFEFEYEKNTYFVTIKNLIQKNYKGIEKKLLIVILSDITQIKNNQKLREQFFENASHELKTPLTSIKGFNDLLAINTKDEKCAEFVNRIAKETDRMLVLIEDMLKLSELEKKDSSHLEAVELEKIATDVIENLTVIAKEKNIELSLSGKANLLANQSHIYDLIKNLVENAIKYNNIGGKVQIVIDSSNNGVKLSVIDNGIGIAKPEQERIFERFYRVEKGRSRVNGGTGLGLSIVKHICELHNASLTLKSSLGVGTEITIQF